MKTKKISKCIYCLSPNSPIDEHVIPLSLGGQSTLQLASCQNCADITSAIITKTTHGIDSLFGKTRIILQMPSRRKKNRPKTLSQKVIDENTNKFDNIDVATSEFVDDVYLPIYPLPGIITKNVVNHGIITEGIQVIHANPNKAKKGKKYIHEFRWDSYDFPKLLALIAYCTAVDEFGLETVSDSPLVPIILGKTDDFGTWIGTANDYVMKMQNKLVDVAYNRPNGHFLMRIKFFNWLTDMPEYLVGVK